MECGVINEMLKVGFNPVEVQKLQQRSGGRWGCGGTGPRAARSDGHGAVMPRIRSDGQSIRIQSAFNPTGTVLSCPAFNLQGPLGDVLDTRQLVSDVSGAGNNWAHGHHEYGPRYHEVRGGWRLGGWSAGRSTTLQPASRALSGHRPSLTECIPCAKLFTRSLRVPHTSQAVMDKVRLTTEECDSLQVRRALGEAGRV
jgi:hypothetical protein